jgi:ABC-type branched-subunit amino acid transport system substrate-binding protein
MRNIGDDRQQSYLLIDYAYRKMNYEKLGIIRASNRYGRFGVREIRDGARRLQKPVPVEMAYKVGQEDFALELERLQKSGVDAIVHWGDAIEGALILNQMRKMGMKHAYLACDRCAHPDFVRIAGANAEGVVCAYPWNPKSRDRLYLKLRDAYRARFGQEPETYAAHAYDGMNMIIWAIQVAGLNRAKIRDVLAYLPEPWPGVAGEIRLSACLDDVGDVFLAEFKDGEWHYYSRADLGIPKGYIPPRDRVSRPDTTTAHR